MNTVCVFLILLWPVWLTLRYQRHLPPEQQLLRAMLLLLLPLPVFWLSRLLPFAPLAQAQIAMLALFILVGWSYYWIARRQREHAAISTDPSPNGTAFALSTYVLLLLISVLLVAQALVFLNHVWGDGSYAWAQLLATQLLLPKASMPDALNANWLNAPLLSLWPAWLASLHWPSLISSNHSELNTKLPYLALWVLQSIVLLRLWQRHAVGLLSRAVLVLLLLLLPKGLLLFAQASSFSLILILLLIVLHSLGSAQQSTPPQTLTQPQWLLLIVCSCLLTPLAFGLLLPYALIYYCERQPRGRSIMTVVAWLCPALMLGYWQMTELWLAAQIWVKWPAASEQVGLTLYHWRSNFSVLLLMLLGLLILLCRAQLRARQAAVFMAWMWTLFVLFLSFTPDAWWFFTQGSDPATAPELFLSIVLFAWVPILVQAMAEAIHTAQGLVLTSSAPKMAATADATATPDAASADPRPLLERALVLQQAGETQAAKDLYLEVLALDPLHPDAQHLLGLIAMSQNALAEAEDRIKKAIAVYPEHALFHQSLADVFSKQLRFAEAVDALDKSLVLDPKNLVAKTKLLAAKRKLTQQQAVNKAIAQNARSGYEIIVNKPKD